MVARVKIESILSHTLTEFDIKISVDQFNGLARMLSELYEEGYEAGLDAGVDMSRAKNEGFWFDDH